MSLRQSGTRNVHVSRGVDKHVQTHMLRGIEEGFGRVEPGDLAFLREESYELDRAGNLLVQPRFNQDGRRSRRLLSSETESRIRVRRRI